MNQMLGAGLPPVLRLGGTFDVAIWQASRDGQPARASPWGPAGQY
jgi:hypothetical protein